MKVHITFKANKPDLDCVTNRVTFPPELPYLVIGAFPKIVGKSMSVFLPEIKTLEISD